MKFRLLILLVCVHCNLYGQGKESSNNLVLDTVLHNKLWNYLLDNPSAHTRDTNGKIVPLSRSELEEMYEDFAVSSSNLRFDSINTNKTLTGIYKFGYAIISEPRWLYIQHRDRIEFINLNKEKLDINKMLKQISSFFKENPEFTEKEKLMMVKRAMEVAYSNMYDTWTW